MCECVCRSVFVCVSVISLTIHFIILLVYPKKIDQQTENIAKEMQTNFDKAVNVWVLMNWCYCRKCVCVSDRLQYHDRNQKLANN